jgi:hypothetical protein
MRVPGGIMFKGLLSRPIFLLVLVTLTDTWGLKAQTEPRPAVPEPQYINAFVAVDASGKLTQLDHQNVTTIRSKVKALPGYATVKVLAEIKPAHASVRLPASSQFVVRGRLALDPASLYELRLLKTSKNHREVMMTQGHGTIFGGSATSNLDEGALPIRFEEYGENSYRITPEYPLARGEYALLLRGVVTDLYCFGVDR